MDKTTVSMEQLSIIANKLFSAMGYSEKDASYAADVLVETDRRGVDTHGMTRLGFYHWSVTEGSINRNARLKILRDEPPFLMADADNGLGIIMAPQAVELAIQRAKEHGICVMGVSNSNHYGAAGYYAAKCVKEGFITIVSSNSPPTAAPYGGKEKALGNSPWSMAIPGGNCHPDPVMFDMACSEVSRGTCETALREGRSIPLGWGIDPDGNPSTDPAEVLKGSLLPFGGIKGYCVTVLVEALSSILTFATFGNGTNMTGGSHNTSHFILLLDPVKFGDLDTYKRGIDEYVENIKRTPLAPGFEEIIIPGELETRAIKRRTEHGRELDGAVADSLAEVALKLGLLTEGQGFADMLTW